MNSIYQHWSEHKTLERMFGDRAAVCELIKAFLSQYPESLRIVRDAPDDASSFKDEVHNLRSLFGIFHAEAGHSLVLSLDRELRAGRRIAADMRPRLIEELEGLARELEDFLAKRGAP